MSIAMRLAHVLTYHSGNIAGNDYRTNDLVAFREDLQVVRALGLPIVPLRSVVDALLEDRCGALPERVVSISFDDGLDFDYLPLQHPVHGRQPSAADIMREFAAEYALPVHATLFVIASPEARAQIAHREMMGYAWINDSWWAAAVESGMFHVANHTWDHMSPYVAHAASEAERRASSRYIDHPAIADLEIRRAHDYIESVAPNPGSALLAFPYGDYSDYLVDDYLPDARQEHGTIAAFTTEPGAITPKSSRWTLPRHTCGADWRSPEGLAALLRR
jgi:peptidoglycan/xylan/chitin deacetylase (PgdA/CDA1 family)